MTRNGHGSWTKKGPDKTGPLAFALLRLSRRSDQRRLDRFGHAMLVAGPGSGKSFTIEDRVAWLLGNGIQPDRLFALSFTNASARDLRFRITQYCQSQGQPGDQVSVTTMHSLAMRMLRAAGLLQRFPVPPIVMDQWELRNIFTEEFCRPLHITVDRAEKIRRDREAFWSTGNFNPPNYIPPNPPITTQERDYLSDFLTRFEQVYSCILPGEIVRECVDQIRAGVVVPSQLIPIDQLIVDEYQDLNPIDLEFIDSLITEARLASLLVMTIKASTPFALPCHKVFSAFLKLIKTPATIV